MEIDAKASSDAYCQVNRTFFHRDEYSQTDSPSLRMESYSQTPNDGVSTPWSQTSSSLSLDITPSLKNIPSLDSFNISLNFPPVDTSPLNYIPFNVERIAFDPNNLDTLFDRVKKVTGHTAKPTSISPNECIFIDDSYDSMQVKLASENSLKQTADALKLYGSSSFIYENDDEFDLDYIRSATKSSLQLTADTINAVQGSAASDVEEREIADIRKVAGRSLLRTAETVEFYYSGFEEQ
jgi:hypothetical protein